MKNVWNAPDYVPVLRGSCNQCGRCCQVEYENETYSCSHLALMGDMGTPMATQCLVYRDRVHGMPIVLSAPSGNTLPGRCAGHQSDEERRNIIARGVGKGCSLTVVGDDE